MGKYIEMKKSYVKNTNMVNQKALIELMAKKGVLSCLMEDTIYSDNSQEIKITITVPKDVNNAKN